MKNCQITIKRKDHHSVSYTFDDFRIAQAVINILDQVAEPCVVDGDDIFKLKYIHKDIHEE